MLGCCLHRSAGLVVVVVVVHCGDLGTIKATDNELPIAGDWCWCWGWVGAGEVSWCDPWHRGATPCGQTPPPTLHHGWQGAGWVDIEDV